MRTLRLTIEYDGTRYSGWQEQTNAKSISGEIRRAAEEFFERPVEIGGAGRTDAGVHALEQVAHLRFPRWGSSPPRIRERLSNLAPREIVHGINDRLPSDINLLAVADTPPGFHARHDAISRSYLYRISTRRSAFEKRHVWWVRDRLQLPAMAEAAARLTGRHDFSAFCERDPRRDEQSTIVHIDSATIVRDDHLLLFRLVASHFLWKMVRRLTGSLVEVGRGNVTVEQFARLLDAPGEPNPLLPAKVTAPPSGLFLERIGYRS